MTPEVFGSTRSQAGDRAASPRHEDSDEVKAWIRESLDPFHPAWIAPRPPVRGPYVGNDLDPLTRVILDQYVVARLSFGRRPHVHAYWAGEVEEARTLVSRWSEAVTSGMAPEDVVRWIAALSKAASEQAAALFAEGIDPDELDQGPGDAGRPSMATRLTVGNMTVDQVIVEVRRRRAAG
jgi:hypothetical protein